MSRQKIEMRGGAAPAGETSRQLPSASWTGDVYFSADVETDGPIPGEFSMLSFALVYAGRYDGATFERPADYTLSFESALKPIASRFDQKALDVNGLDREALLRDGPDPAAVMQRATDWVRCHANGGTPILVAYPLSFDWTWLYWYFVKFVGASPFNHSRCFDLKTAIAVRGQRPVSLSGHDRLPEALRSNRPHTHRALDDAIEQADMLAKLFEWDGK